MSSQNTATANRSAADGERARAKAIVNAPSTRSARTAASPRGDAVAALSAKYAEALYAHAVALHDRVSALPCTSAQIRSFLSEFDVVLEPWAIAGLPRNALLNAVEVAGDALFAACVGAEGSSEAAEAARVWKSHAERQTIKALLQRVQSFDTPLATESRQANAPTSSSSSVDDEEKVLDIADGVVPTSRGPTSAIRPTDPQDATPSARAPIVAHVRGGCFPLMTAVVPEDISHPSEAGPLLSVIRQRFPETTTPAMTDYLGLFFGWSESELKRDPVSAARIGGQLIERYPGVLAEMRAQREAPSHNLAPTAEEVAGVLAVGTSADLVMYVDRAVALLSECRDALGAKEILSKARAVETYLRALHAGREAEVAAAEVVVRAHRRLGEVTSTLPTARAGRKKNMSHGATHSSVGKGAILANANLTRQEAARAEKAASIPAPAFENYIAASKAAGKPPTMKAALALAKTRPPIARDVPYGVSQAPRLKTLIRKLNALANEAAALATDLNNHPKAGLKKHELVLSNMLGALCDGIAELANLPMPSAPCSCGGVPQCKHCGGCGWVPDGGKSPGSTAGTRPGPTPSRTSRRKPPRAA